ncbi:RNA polymerase sigma factor [Tunicatimonas pelagia]|uniref:RNA polymerase sigma factor n=1 Tax=Tunicatimonas pelagia TaxID=931531 RepID=UPI002666650E|nr:sigma-70 family RNA polymerase sigma factor [Tunicatimonas pelagia]WKN40969.1 sigma-70 family RNA polymerase sigma factor [Tunicatimonas pelagia]
MKEDTLKKAINGDITAFQKLFLEFQAPLKSYLYRLLTDRNDVDDLAQDTFVKAFDKISTFSGASSLKTWVFRIATHLAYDHLRRQKRWLPDAQDKSKALAMSTPEIGEAFAQVHQHSPYGAYDVREHIDFCFTCISKTLTIEQQVALILKDVYHFSRKEISGIMGKTEGVVKHLLFDSRKLMIDIFDQRCALINKNGVCHQCTELAGVFNPKQIKREELLKIKMVAEAESSGKRQLYELRAQLAAEIDPLRSAGADMQDIIMQCTRQAVGEIESLN